MWVNEGTNLWKIHSAGCATWGYIPNQIILTHNNKIIYDGSIDNNDTIKLKDIGINRNVEMRLQAIITL